MKKRLSDIFFDDFPKGNGQFHIEILTGEWHGDVEAELTDFSFSSGISMDDIRAFRADKRRRFWTGLEGAAKWKQTIFQKTRHDKKHLFL